MGKQGKGRRLTDKERMEIIALTRQNPRIKHVELAAKYNVNESTIRKWRAQGNASKIEERYSQGVAASRDSRQRGQPVRNPQFDLELYEWISGMLKQDHELSPARIREKARAMAALHEGMEGFKASSGWFYRFCRRYGIPCGSSSREDNPGELVDAAAMADALQLAASEAMVNAAAHESHASAAMDTQSAMSDQTVPESATAIVMSLQPPPASTANEVENQSHQENAMELSSAPSDLLLGLGEMSASSSSTSVSFTSTAAESAVTQAEPTPEPTPATVDGSSFVPATMTAASMAMFSPSHAAATHLLQNYKDVVDPQTRLRLVRHLSRVPGEAEMYLVMDDETRLEYVKEFAIHGAIAASETAEVDSA